MCSGSEEGSYLRLYGGVQVDWVGPWGRADLVHAASAKIALVPVVEEAFALLAPVLKRVKSFMDEDETPSEQKEREEAERRKVPYPYSFHCQFKKIP